MLKTKEILNRLTTEIGTDFNSRGTLAAEKLYTELFEELDKTLDDEQREISHKIDGVYLSIVGGCFNDGIAYGFMLAKRMNEILNNPEKAFAEVSNSAEDYHNNYYEEFKFLWDLKRSSQEGGAVA